VGVRSYGQYCALARALDAIGDRWSLLIVRELLLRPCRYTDLRDGLPGIATNLLAERLRRLEEAGVVTREEAPPPVATTLYHLSEWGKGLEAVVHELVRWGAPLMTQPAGHDEFRSRWLVLAVQAMLGHETASSRDLTIQVEAGGEPVLIRGIAGRVVASTGTRSRPDLVIRGRPEGVLGLLSGLLGPSAARAAGLHIKGDVAVLRALVPRLVHGFPKGRGPDHDRP
jgi:DNA-binding HxlR family transcriptional regulator